MSPSIYSKGLCISYFFQGASSGRSEGGPRLNHLWTSSTLGAGKGLFRPRMHPAPMCLLFISPLFPAQSSPKNKRVESCASGLAVLSVCDKTRGSCHAYPTALMGTSSQTLDFPRLFLAKLSQSSVLLTLRVVTPTLRLISA